MADEKERMTEARLKEISRMVDVYEARGYHPDYTKDRREMLNEISRLQAEAERLRGENRTWNAHFPKGIGETPGWVAGLVGDRDRLTSEVASLKKQLGDLFDTSEGEATLTVNILRKWDREKLVRFATHLLGDSAERGLCAALKWRDDRISELEKQLEQARGDGLRPEDARGGEVDGN